MLLENEHKKILKTWHPKKSREILLCIQQYYWQLHPVRNTFFIQRINATLSFKYWYFYEYFSSRSSNQKAKIQLSQQVDPSSQNFFCNREHFAVYENFLTFLVENQVFFSFFDDFFKAMMLLFLLNRIVKFSFHEPIHLWPLNFKIKK